MIGLSWSIMFIPYLISIILTKNSQANSTSIQNIRMKRDKMLPKLLAIFELLIRTLMTRVAAIRPHKMLQQMCQTTLKIFCIFFSFLSLPIHFQEGWGMRSPQQELLPNYWGILRMPNTLEPRDSTCSRLRKPNLDAPGPTLLNLQDRTVRRRTERTMLSCLQKRVKQIVKIYT